PKPSSSPIPLFTYSPIHLHAHHSSSSPIHSHPHHLSSSPVTPPLFPPPIPSHALHLSSSPVTQPIFPSAIPVGLEKQSKRDRGGDGRGDKLIKQASNITTQLIPTSEAGDNALVHANWTFSL